jgi:hypothetical protein
VKERILKPLNTLGCALHDSETPLEFSDLGVFRTLVDFMCPP